MKKKKITVLKKEPAEPHLPLTGLRTTGGTSFFTSVSSESLTDDDDDDDDDDSVSLCGSVFTTVAPGSSMWWWREWCELAEDGSIMEEDEEDNEDDGGSFLTFIFFFGRSGGKGEAVDVLWGGRFIWTCARVMMSWRVMPRVSRSTELCGCEGWCGGERMVVMAMSQNSLLLYALS